MRAFVLSSPQTPTAEVSFRSATSGQLDRVAWVRPRDVINQCCGLPPRGGSSGRAAIEARRDRGQGAPGRRPASRSGERTIGQVHSVPSPGKKLGMSEPKRSRVPAAGLNPYDDQKVGSTKQMNPDGHLRNLRQNQPNSLRQTRRGSRSLD
jgi:hypothetical protein